MKTALLPRAVRLLFSHGITILETFLAEYATANILGNEEYLKAFVAKYKEFNEECFTLSQIFQKHEGIAKHVRKALADIIWHNLPKVKNIYEFAFGITIEKEIGELQRAVSIRHDIVHRNGKDKDGKEVLVTKFQVESLLKEVEEIAGEINRKIEKA